jgi:hypothetical protein
MDKAPLLLIIAAAVILITGGLIAASTGGTSLLGNGQEVQCSTSVSARLNGAFDIKDGANCRRIDACTVNPLRSFWIGDVNGKLQLLQSGTVYASKDITKNILAAAGSFQITACVPKDASQVRLQVVNDQGGVDDDIATDIQ